jgi:hypothetical protein
MALDLFLVWYLLMGFLLANGVPHFVFGAAGKVFRSPFGQKSKPKTNVLWGLSNLILATMIAIGLMVSDLYDSYALIVMLLGFWLVVIFQFGLGIKRFLND